MRQTPGSPQRRAAPRRHARKSVAIAYYVIVSWAQYKTAERKGLARLSDDWPKIVDLLYDEEYGFRLDVGGGHGL